MDSSYQKRLLSVISGIMDTVHTAIVITDLECNFLLKNKHSDEFIKLIGKGRIQEYLRKISENLSPEKTRYSEHLMFQNLIPGKPDLEIDCSVTRIPDQEFLIWSFHDLSLQKAAEREAELHKQKANHAEKMASIGEMSTSIVHEIRNPLTIITGQLSLAQEYLNRGKMNDEFCQRLIDRLEKSGNRINGIIKSLLNLSRNTGNDEMKPFSLNEILDEVDLFSSLKIKGFKVPLEIKEPEKDYRLLCHPSEVTQVLINLVKNAKEEVFTQKDPWVRIEISTTPNTLRISVIDSGSGISDEVAQKIFQPYFTTKEIGEGTGIGLSLCKKLVEEVQRAFYLNKDHPNTCFVVEFPHNSQDQLDI